MADENLTWNDHIHVPENNLAKNYGNIAWTSTTKSKLRKIASQQRQAVNAIPKNDNQEITNSRKLWKKMAS